MASATAAAATVGGSRRTPAAVQSASLQQFHAYCRNSPGTFPSTRRKNGSRYLCGCSVSVTKLTVRSTVDSLLNKRCFSVRNRSESRSIGGTSRPCGCAVVASDEDDNGADEALVATEADESGLSPAASVFAVLGAAAAVVVVVASELLLALPEAA